MKNMKAVVNKKYSKIIKFNMINNTIIVPIQRFDKILNT